MDEGHVGPISSSLLNAMQTHEDVSIRLRVFATLAGCRGIGLVGLKTLRTSGFLVHMNPDGIAMRRKGANRGLWTLSELRKSHVRNSVGNQTAKDLFRNDSRM
jgi:hypothetical protein